jgi:hypothetical protein
LIACSKLHVNVWDATVDFTINVKEKREKRCL